MSITRRDLFFVPGSPAPQGSKRHVGGGRMIESSKYVGPWRATIAGVAGQCIEYGPRVGPVAVALDFVLPRPKSEPKTTRPHTRRPDVDKLARAVLDALTGIYFADDSQVDSLAATKRTAEPGEQPGVHICVEGKTEELRTVVVGGRAA